MANHPWGMPDIPPISAQRATRAIDEAYLPQLDAKIPRALDTRLSGPRYLPCILGSSIVERAPSPMNLVIMRKSHSSPLTPLMRDSYSADSQVTYKGLVGSSRQTTGHRTYANITTGAHRVIQPAISNVIPRSTMVTRIEPITSTVPQYRMPVVASFMTTIIQSRQQPIPIPYANRHLQTGQE